MFAAYTLRTEKTLQNCFFLHIYRTPAILKATEWAKTGPFLQPVYDDTERCFVYHDVQLFMDNTVFQISSRLNIFAQVQRTVLQ